MTEEMKQAQREAYEVAKMIKALEYEGHVGIVSNDKGQYCAIMNRPEMTYLDDESVRYNMEITTLEEEWFASIYDAVKYQYFAYVREESHTENISLDIESSMVDRLYEIADERGVIIDEIIIAALEETLSEYAECNCQSKCPTCNCR